MSTPEERRHLRLAAQAEQKARQRLLDTYLAAAGEYARSVVGVESYEALMELRRINETLREHGYPAGAAGVEDALSGRSAAS